MGTILTIKKTNSVSGDASAEELRRKGRWELPSKGAEKRRAGILRYFDIALIGLSALGAFRGSYFYAHLAGIPGMSFLAQTRLLGFLLVHSVCLVLLVQSHGLYSAAWKRSFREELSGLAESVASAAVILFAALFFTNASSVSFVVAGLTIGIGWFAMAGWRRFLYAQSIPGLTERRNIVIVGAGQLALRLKSHIENNPELGFVVCGFIDRRKKARDANGNIQEDSRFLGNVEDLSAVVRAHFVDEIFICVPGDRDLIEELAVQAKHLGVHLRVVPEILEDDPVRVEVEYVGELPTMTLQKSAIPTAGMIFKRLIDITVSFLALPILLPILLVIGIAVKLDSKGPVLYRSFRVGRKGKAFLCYKFRTMVADADQVKDSLRHLNERSGATFKITGDPRITSVGRFLRKYSLDELPQFWNVLMGDLSLVGPRPHPLDDYSKYALEDRRRLEVKPGITGLWQVTARGDASFEKNVALDIEYIQNWSFWLDCRILWKTLAVVVAGTGQ